MARIAFAALTVAAALGASGCGGKEEPPTTTASPTASQPAEQLIKQAERICAAGTRKLYARGLPPMLDPAQLSGRELGPAADFLRRDLEVSREEAGRLAALSPPAGREEEWASVLDGLRNGIVPSIADAADAVRADDPTAYDAAMRRLRSTTAELDHAKEKIGLNACGDG